MKPGFKKEHGMHIRETLRGKKTYYAQPTITDEDLIHAIGVVHERTGKSPNKLLGEYIKRAWDKLGVEELY